MPSAGLETLPDGDKPASGLHVARLTASKKFAITPRPNELNQKWHRDYNRCDSAATHLRYSMVRCAC